jgi:hypothetical protein
MPPSDFFFSKKRRAIVKRETHQKDGAIVKRKRMMYDGQTEMIQNLLRKWQVH